MRRFLLSLCSTLFLALIAGCGGGESSSNSITIGSSTVSITVGDKVQSVSLRVVKNTFVARASMLLREIVSTNTAIAAIPSSVVHIVFTISAPDMTTITRDVLIAGQSSVTESFTVPNGYTRHFLVEAKGASSSVLFRQETFANLDGSPVTLALTMNDVAPPTFAGVQSATPVSPSQINLTWNPATDNLTASPNIIYYVYESKTPGGENFASPSYITTPGATSFQVTGLESNTTYYFTVRADDRSGNIDTNLIEKAATTFDATPPTFAGLVSATPSATTSGKIDLSWSAATDNVTPSSNIVYQIYMSTTSGGQNFAVPTVTTTQGATSFTVTGLSPGIYYFVVRARDEAGNTEANLIEKSASSDIVPPTVISVVPPNGAVNILTTSTITINFSEPMLTATITGSTFYLLVSNCEGNCVVPASITFSNNGTTATLTPSANLRSLTNYTVYVTAGVADLSGNKMSAAFTSTVTTEQLFTTVDVQVIFPTPPGAPVVGITK